MTSLIFFDAYVLKYGEIPHTQVIFIHWQPSSKQTKKNYTNQLNFLPCVLGLVKNFLKYFTNSKFVTFPPCISIKLRISASDNSLGPAIVDKTRRKTGIYDSAQ